MRPSTAIGWIALLGLVGATPAFGDDVSTPQTGSLTVVFHSCESDEGKAIVALLDSEASYDAEDEAFRQARAEIANGEARVQFEDVPYGTYAIKVIHDANDNGELDTNFIGLPKEAFGFSNDAMGRIGPPGFDAASFELEQPEQVMKIQAKRF